MKPRIGNQRNRALTVIEALVVFACGLVLMAIILPTLTRPRRPRGINCVSNLKQVNLAFRIWEGDNNNQFPMGVSVTNGGGMELIEAGNPIRCFQCASNEMSTTKIFVCPADPDRTFATNFDDLDGSHISYFLGSDVSNEDNPAAVLDGDDNLVIAGNPVKSGLIEYSTNSSIAWSGKRHKHVGNIGLADGSVEQTSSEILQDSFQFAGLATNRIVIP